MTMLHQKDLEELLLQDYNHLNKQQILEKISAMYNLIDESLEYMQQEYKTWEYNYTFKQTFKHLLKHKHRDYTMADLQLQKDLIVHYREMLQLDVMMLGKHMTELLANNILDKSLLNQQQRSINELHHTIAHLSAIIKSLKEITVEWR